MPVFLHPCYSVTLIENPFIVCWIHNAVFWQSPNIFTVCLQTNFQRFSGLINSCWLCRPRCCVLVFKRCSMLLVPNDLERFQVKVKLEIFDFPISSHGPSEALMRVPISAHVWEMPASGVAYSLPAPCPPPSRAGSLEEVIRTPFLPKEDGPCCSSSHIISNLILQQGRADLYFKAVRNK